MSSHKCRSLARSFVDRYGLWGEAQVRAAAAVDKAIVQKNLELVRFSFPDQHGVLRGKTLLAREASQALRNGVAMTSTLLAKDTAHRTVFPVFEPGAGRAGNGRCRQFYHGGRSADVSHATLGRQYGLGFV